MNNPGQAWAQWPIGAWDPSAKGPHRGTLICEGEPDWLTLDALAHSRGWDTWGVPSSSWADHWTSWLHASRPIAVLRQNDEASEALALQITGAIARKFGMSAVKDRVTIHRPPDGVGDWNDWVQADPHATLRAILGAVGCS